MIALLIAAWLGAGTGTVHVDGGLTSSARTVVLPPAPPWASGVRLRVRHTSEVLFGWETDQYGGPVTWGCQAAVRVGWALMDGGSPVAASRVTAATVQQGLAVPFDGAWDWAGLSGGQEAHVRLSASPWVLVPVSDSPLVLSTQARSEWSIGIAAPYIPPSGGTVWWLNRTNWQADVDYEFVP